MKQISFLEKPKKEHGGSLGKGKRKTARTLSTQQPIHLVLKSNKSVNLFEINKRNEILIYLDNYCKKFNIHLYSWSVQVDHIHLCIRVYQRENYHKFIRSLTGVLARRWGKGVWKVLPYSRLINWGRDFNNVLIYIEMNEAEVQGFRSMRIS